MGANVFANGREISARKSDNESIAAMPDVCLSPPSPPAGPIPIPYPNFSNAHDTSNGTKTVKIAGDEVGMKNLSNYKTSKGDEAATRALGMGEMTHTIEGTTYFAAWSSDVMVEGANVTRFMDLTTHNHASDPANTLASQTSVASAAPPLVGDTQCVGLEKRLQQIEKKYPTGDTKTGAVDAGQVLATAEHSVLGAMKSGSESIMKRNIVSSRKNGYLKRPKRPKVGGKSTEPNIACTNESYNNWTCNSGHAEGKAIQHIFQTMASSGGMAGTTLTVRIRWNDGINAYRDEPCPACKSAICKTAQQCDMAVELCMQENGKLEKKAAPCDGGVWNSSLWS